MQLLLLIVLPLLVLMACGDVETAEERDAIPDASPTALAALPQGIEEATVHLADGRFDVGEVFLQEAQPTVLHVVNEDDRAYRLRIVEDLVTATPIAANATTDVEFTTPNAGRYEGQLLPAEGEEVLDTVAVIVQAPGGVEP